MRFTALPRAVLVMSSNGELFAQFIQDVYGTPEPVQEEKPTGPRRPAPVPEAGTAGRERSQAEAEAREQAEHNFFSALNQSFY